MNVLDNVKRMLRAGIYTPEEILFQIEFLEEQIERNKQSKKVSKTKQDSQ